MPLVRLEHVREPLERQVCDACAELGRDQRPLPSMTGLRYFVEVVARPADYCCRSPAIDLVSTGDAMRGQSAVR